MEIQFWQLVQRGNLRLQNQDVFEWRHCDVIELIPPLCLLIDQIFIYEDYLQEVSWFLHKMRWWVFAKVPHHQSTYISFFTFRIIDVFTFYIYFVWWMYQARRLQRQIQSPVKHLRWSILKKRFSLLAFNYFHKMLHLRCLTAAWCTFQTQM